MTTASTTPADRTLAAPHQAAIAGVISAILSIAGLTLAMLAFSGAQASTPAWLKGPDQPGRTPAPGDDETVNDILQTKEARR
jgi:hypothetical protein